jgi:hypothetical protein
MITAYVLIQAEVGSSADVGAKIARIEGVKFADVVTGVQQCGARSLR